MSTAYELHGGVEQSFNYSWTRDKVLRIHIGRGLPTDTATRHTVALWGIEKLAPTSVTFNGVAGSASFVQEHSLAMPARTLVLAPPTSQPLLPIVVEAIWGQ